MKKSKITQLVLTLLLGPIESLPCISTADISLIILAVLIGSFTAGIGALILWPVSIIMGFITVNSYNERMKALMGGNEVKKQYQPVKKQYQPEKNKYQPVEENFTKEEIKNPEADKQNADIMESHRKALNR